MVKALYYTYKKALFISRTPSFTAYHTYMHNCADTHMLCKITHTHTHAKLQTHTHACNVTKTDTHTCKVTQRHIYAMLQRHTHSHPLFILTPTVEIKPSEKNLCDASTERHETAHACTHLLTHAHACTHLLTHACTHTENTHTHACTLTHIETPDCSTQ